jgi:hypothetical protein
MQDPAPISNSTPSVSAPQPTRANAGARKGADLGEGALAFKVLLDQLEERAQALEAESKADLSKDDLAGAIDNARASLEQMLTLKDQLLEAWRASEQGRASRSR